jgi:hypothetical protein
MGRNRVAEIKINGKACEEAGVGGEVYRQSCG